MKTRIFLFLFLSLSCHGVLSQNKVSAPKGKPVMIDGKFSLKEWDDAAAITTLEGVKLFFKQADGYVYIGIKPPSEGYKGGWVDLYIADSSNEIFNLHASRKLGERKLENGQWPDWDKWWTNEGRWRANYLRYDDVKEEGKTKTVQLTDDGWEYQINKNTFAKGNWKIFFDVSMVHSGLRNIKYPENSSALNTDKWLTLNF